MPWFIPYRMAIKKKIKKVLQDNNIYLPIRYSFFFRLYQRMFKSGDIAAEKKEIDFYKSFFSSCGLIFDIGAYDGHKTAAFLHIARKVVCVEPDKENFKVLGIRFRHKKDRVYLENKAVSNVAGTSYMHIHHPASAFNTLSDNWKDILESDNVEKWNEKISFPERVLVETITLDQLIEKYGRPDFIKIDVEGLEEKVLQGLSSRVSCLTFEAMLPDGLEAIHNCLAQIERLDTDARFNVAEYEQLLFEKFVSFDEIRNWLAVSRITHFEIVVKMNL